MSIVATCRGGNYKAIVEQLRSVTAEARLYILIHNIDGPGANTCHVASASQLLPVNGLTIGEFSSCADSTINRLASMHLVLARL